MSSAQLDLQPFDKVSDEADSAPFALKEQVADRLASHRARRARPADSSMTPTAVPVPLKGRGRSANIAAAVAERYAHSKSYRAFIAEEAERAIQQAEAAAEVAARTAQAVADVQNQLLFELDQIAVEAPTPAPVPTTPMGPIPALGLLAHPDLQAEPPATPQVSSVSQAHIPAPIPGLTVRLYEQVVRPSPEPFATSYPVRSHEFSDEAEGLALDDEIAFRQSPVFEEPAGTPVEIPANLIEFPRQLVAARKARPRLAEGPLREESDTTVQSAQLRIFEVEAAQISSAPSVDSVAPEWSSILLGAQPASALVAETAEAKFSPRFTPQFNPTITPQTATLSLRLMAAMVDGCIILATFVAFAAVFALTVSKLPGSTARPYMNVQTSAIASAGTLAVLALLYQLLFFTFSEATPGMRYARIGLCTLSDDNPTRSAMRRRIFAIFLSGCPLGIGFLWALLDEDGLSWHDRISRMYQRSY